jgi:hypothetical protein
MNPHTASGHSGRNDYSISFGRFQHLPIDPISMWAQTVRFLKNSLGIPALEGPAAPFCPVGKRKKSDPQSMHANIYGPNAPEWSIGDIYFDIFIYLF